MLRSQRRFNVLAAYMAWTALAGAAWPDPAGAEGLVLDERAGLESIVPAPPALGPALVPAIGPAPASPLSPASALGPGSRLGEPPRLGRDLAQAPLTWWLPTLEVFGTAAVMNAYGRIVLPDPTFHVTWASVERNLGRQWAYDSDRFPTNQFNHPYEGAVYFSTARTLGHGFWTSSAFAFTGSLLWEIGMEVEPPSVNDQITTTVAGSFLGEVLYRLASRVLDGGGERPGGWREAGAAALSPINGLHRGIFGDRYRAPPEAAPFGGDFRVGARLAGGPHDAGGRGHGPAAVVSTRLVQGQPGTGSPVDDPFDYFDLAAGLAVEQGPAGRRTTGDFSVHGLVLGQGGDAGLWGLFGTYDYLTHDHIFRASSSALGIGAVGTGSPGDGWVLEGEAIASIGYGAGGSLVEPVGNRDYHFGLQGVLFAQGGVVWRDRLALELRLRQYFVSGNASPENDSWEDMTFAQADLGWRIAGAHAIHLEAGLARRQARYPGASVDQAASTIGVAWAYQLGRTLHLSGVR